MELTKEQFYKDTRIRFVDDECGEEIKELFNWINKKISQVQAKVKPMDYGTCENCIFNLEDNETSLVSECQLTIDEFTGIGLQFSRDFGCNQWQGKPSV